MFCFVWKTAVFLYRLLFNSNTFKIYLMSHRHTTCDLHRSSFFLCYRLTPSNKEESGNRHLNAMHVCGFLCIRRDLWLRRRQIFSVVLLLFNCWKGFCCFRGSLLLVVGPSKKCLASDDNDQLSKAIFLTIGQLIE